MLKLFRRTRELAVEFCERCGSVGDAARRRNALVERAGSGHCSWGCGSRERKLGAGRLLRAAGGAGAERRGGGGDGGAVQGTRRSGAGCGSSTCS